MPSQKHKKRKKASKNSHRQHRKRRASSSSWNEDIRRVDLSSSDSEDSQNEERLISLVRKSYIKHLQEALTQNFDGWIDKSNTAYQDSIPELVQRWSSVLEQKALRACMLTEIYRTSMVSMIKQIRSSTTDGRLFIKEKSLDKLKTKIPLDKEIQTDKTNVAVCSSETQTESIPCSLLELPLPKNCLSPSSRPYDPAVDFSDSQSSDAGVSSSISFKPIEPVTATSTAQDVCNITSTSDVSHPLQVLFDSLKATDKESRLDTPRPLSHRTSTVNLLTTGRVTAITPNSVSKRKSCEKSKDLGDFDQKDTQCASNKPANINNQKNHNDNLDARLTAMGLLSDIGSETENAVSQLPIMRSKKSNWFAEEIAHSCNFSRIFLKMTTKQRIRVLARIKELFGEENEPLMVLSDKNVAICRKRIASVVVMELTPIYQNKRIVSRHLFKFLAKKITKSIMEQSYAPDSRTIRYKVKKFFSDGKVIKAESDCI